MKLIHCADLHLDSRMETNLTVEQAKERKAELLNTFERLVDYAAKNAVEVVIIAGDMFDTAYVATSTKNRVLNAVRRHSEIDFLYLSGNHDESNFIANLDEVPANLKIFGDRWTTYSYPAVEITGMVTNANNAKDMYRTLALRPEKLNIVVLHGQITESATDKGENLSLKLLQNHAIDYLALGHIHSFTAGVLDQRGQYCYAGCLEGRGFDECGEKGFVLLEITDGKMRTEFVPFATRQLIELPFDVTEYTDWFAVETAVLKQVQKLPSKNLLKVVLTGKYPVQMEKHTLVLEQKLRQQFYFAKVKDETTLAVNSQEFLHDVSLRGEFVRQVMASELSETEKSQTIEIGLRALAGEDL